MKWDLFTLHCCRHRSGRTEQLSPCTRFLQASWSNCTTEKMQKRNIACCSSLFSKTSFTASNVLSQHLKVVWFCREKKILFLLYSLLYSLVCCGKSCSLSLLFVSGELWWNPEKLDMSTCCYLQLLCHLFDVVVSGASQGPLLLRFKALFQPLLKVCYISFYFCALRLLDTNRWTFTAYIGKRLLDDGTFLLLLNICSFLHSLWILRFI